MEWCSKSENEKHAYRTRLKTSKASIQNLRKAQEISRNFWGEKMPWAKLKEKDVLEIRKAYDSKEMTKKELADKYGLEIHSILNIVNRKTWTKLP